MKGHLRPKDEFKEGRKECFRALYECSEDVDVTSVHPWVMSKN